MNEESEEAAEISKTEYLDEFADLRPDLFFPGDWSPERVDRANESLTPRKVKTAMFSSIPMICRGAQCPHAAVCPLFATNTHPESYNCPIEMAVVATFSANYMKEFGVDASNLVEVSMVRDLVDFEVQYMRAMKTLSQEHFIIDNSVGVDSGGDVIIQKGLHPAVEYEDKILKRKEKVLNAFLATREARNKAGQGLLDPSQEIANLMDKIKDHRTEKDALTLEKLGVNVVDAYIRDDSAARAEEE